MGTYLSNAKQILSFQSVHAEAHPLSPGPLGSSQDLLECGTGRLRKLRTHQVTPDHLTMENVGHKQEV